MQASIRLLLIDEDEDDRRLTVARLKQSAIFYEITSTSTYDAALEKLEQLEFDVCLLADPLGGRTGLALLSEVRRRKPELPVVLLTGDRNLDLDTETIQSGLVDLLVKEEITTRMLDRTIRYTVERAKSFCKLRTSEHFLHAVLDALSANIAILDGDGRIMAVNESWRRFRTQTNLRSPGYSVGSNYLDVARLTGEAGSEIAREAYQGIRDVLAGQSNDFYLEYPHTKAEEKNWFAMRVTRVRDLPGSFVAVAHEDITARKRAEDSIRQSERGLAQAQSIARLGSWDLDLRTGELRCSRELFRVFGLPYQAQATEQQFRSLIHPEDQDRCKRVLEIALTRKTPFTLEHRLITPAGDVRTVCNRGQIVSDPEGNPIRLTGTTHDITDRVRVEEALIARERRFRALLEHSSDVILALSKEGRIVYASPSATHLLGYAQAELLGYDPLFLLPDEERSAAVARMAQVVDLPNGSYETKVRLRHKDQTWRWVEGVVSNALDEPTIQGLVCNFRDVTARHEAEMALRASEERFRSLVESATIGVFEFDTSGAILYASPLFERLTGYTQAEVAAGQVTAKLLTAAECQDALEPLIEGYKETGKFGPVDWAYRCKDGSTLHGIGGGTSLRTADGRGIGYLVDATEQLRIRRELARTEQRLRTLFENANDLVFTTDAEGRITSLNRAARRALGYTLSEAMGRPAVEVLHLDCRRYPEIAGRFRNVDHLEETCEFQTRSRSGRSLILEVSFQRISAGRPDEQIQAIARDITERRQVEHQLRHTQKLEAVGRLAGGIAHDFNNLLTIILGCSGGIARKETISEAVRGKIRMIEDTANRAASLTGQLLAFSRSQTLQKHLVNTNDVISALAPMLKRIIGEDVSFSVRLDPRAGHVLADRSQLEQVIVNLAINARDAMPSGGRLQIETAAVHLSEKDATEKDVSKDGPYVRLRITDSGIGMDETTRSRAFEPFFTTKDVGQGTGLGLATVYGIVKQSDGGIVLQSAPGKGTTIEIHLPYAPAGNTEAPPVQSEFAPDLLLGTVLLVEDEKELRDLVAQTLRGAACEVITAADGDAALELLKQRDCWPDVVVTDVVMPRMGGPALVRKLRQRAAELPAVYMTGYLSGVSDQDNPAHRDYFLQKPFRPQDLLCKVSSAILDGELSRAVRTCPPSQFIIK